MDFDKCHQSNFKDFKRFGAFKELVEQKKKRCIQLVRAKKPQFTQELVK
jgi:hypothetical protein